MSAEVRFLFLLGAIICWGLAAFATRVSPRVGLVPLGLARAFARRASDRSAVSRRCRPPARASTESTAFRSP